MNAGRLSGLSFLDGKQVGRVQHLLASKTTKSEHGADADVEGLGFEDLSFGIAILLCNAKAPSDAADHESGKKYPDNPLPLRQSMNTQHDAVKS